MGPSPLHWSGVGRLSAQSFIRERDFICCRETIKSEVTVNNFQILGQWNEVVTSSVMSVTVTVITCYSIAWEGEIITQTLCKTLAVLFNIDFTTLRTGHRVRSASLAQHLAPAPASTAQCTLTPAWRWGAAAADNWMMNKLSQISMKIINPK